MVVYSPPQGELRHSTLYFQVFLLQVLPVQDRLVSLDQRIKFIVRRKRVSTGTGRVDTGQRE